MEKKVCERTKGNFEMLPKRQFYLEAKNLEILEELKEACLCIGSGGSSAAGYYASKVLESTNGIISEFMYPRDVLYKKSLLLFKNILSIIYSNNNHGINEALKYARNQGLNTYIVTANSECDSNSKLITYTDSFEREHSFISLASTFEPMEVMFRYYFGRFADEVVEEIYAKALEQKIDLNFNEMLPIEIMSGDNTYTAAKILNSTIVEAGLGIPVVHEKDNYRHGCSTLAHHFKQNILIYLLNGDKTELDNILLNEVSSSYRQVILLESNINDKLAGEFDLAIKSMSLCKLITESQNKGLSKVDYNPIVKKLYKYNGGM